MFVAFELNNLISLSLPKKKFEKIDKAYSTLMIA